MVPKTAAALAAFCSIAALTTVAPPPAAAAPFTPATVTVTRVIEVDDPDPGPTQGDGDFYAQVQINAFPTQQGPEVSGEDFEPFWTFSNDVDRAVYATTVPVSVTLYDADGFGAGPDDIIDVNPLDGVQSLQFDLELDTGSWTAVNVPGAPLNQACFRGDGDREHFGFTEGGEEGEICLDFSTISTNGDADGDGLLDGWETVGYDADGDGAIDVDLPGFGADPNHKDLFLELDVMAGNAPTRADIQAVKAAFAAAPAAAGTNGASLPGGASAASNPDGLPGINLWVDTGSLSDPTASEDGAGAGSCGDGVDNGGGDGADGADADCLIGDDLGGGQQIAATGIPSLNSAYYAVKSANFDPDRRLVFRYGLSAAPGFEDGSANGASCLDGVDNGGDGDIDGDDADCWPWGGGWGEVGGNDFIEYNHDGGTIMHELGHTLNLRHGGNESDNCKPNYVSVMNYDLQFGIRQNGGGSILDFSPPRTGTGRGAAPLAAMVESSLDETGVLDPSDASNQFVFTNASGTKVRNPLNATADYNGDGDAADTSVQVNVDDDDSNGNPADCNNGSSTDSHSGFDDWSAISLQFRQFGDAEDGTVGDVVGPEISLPELEALQEALDSADLAITITDSDDPVAAGTELTYQLTVTNDGPNPADQLTITDQLPSVVAYQSDDAGCDHAAGEVTCELGPLEPGEDLTVEIVGLVDPSAAYDNGGPLTITNQATVSNDVGPDPDLSDNSASEDTLVVAEVDLAVDGIEVDGPATGLAVIGEPFDVDVTSTVSNGGPSSPVDVVVTTTASSPGNSVTPPEQSSPVTALAVGAPRDVVETVTLECVEPGEQEFTFTALVESELATDIDPDLSNNELTTVLEVDCVVPIAINVKPGGGNPVTIGSGGVTPLAALTTEAGEYGLPLAFDATTIDADSVRFGPEDDVFGGSGGASETHGLNHPEDSYELDETTRDGDLDDVLHFRTRSTGLAPGDTEACLFGSFVDGGQEFRFFGCDAVRITG
jgi:uncharacterized repeat protein (TIGR01451 family)